MKLHKLFLILFLTLLLPINIFGQAAVDIPLLITESNDPTIFELAVGLDLTATNCIDPFLGEFDLQSVPLPPPGIFEIRFNLNLYGCLGVSSYKDFRAPGNPPTFPFSGTVEHALIWQRSQPGTLINIEYNIPSGAQMRIRDQINGTLINIGPFTGVGVAIIPGTYPLSDAYLFMDYDNFIPVELVSFTASVLQNEKAVQLNWTTATETNNSGFEILRCTQNDNEWNTIGFVPGFGTTTEPKTYSFIDEHISTGTYKYRLKQIDFDGSFEYSNEIEVEVDFTPKEFVLYQNYPNPFNPNTVISYQLPVTGYVTLKVYDILGNEVATLINEEKQPGLYEVEFNSHPDEGQNLTSGVYFYQLSVRGPETSSGQKIIQTKKMILAK